MPTEGEVLRIGKKLEKMIAEKNTDDSSVVDMLKTLQNLPMKLAVLQKTRIGMTVKKLRKASSSDEVVSVSKVLIKAWKKLLPDSGKSDQKKEKPENNGDKNSEEMETESLKSDEPRASTSASETSDIGDNKVEGNDPVELGGLIEDNILVVYSHNWSLIMPLHLMVPRAYSVRRVLPSVLMYTNLC